jgi:photosystem II stability/assembly factor-like uncharacterized protein
LLSLPQRALAFGMRGQLACTDDDDASRWRMLPSGTRAAITAGDALPDGTVVLATQAGELLVSRDAGARFQVQRARSALPCAGVVLVDATRVVVVGPAGARLETLA